MHLCECGCGRAADNVVSSMSSHELAGARYRLACADGGLFQRIRQRRASPAQEPIGITSSGEQVFGAGGGRVTTDGGRTYSRVAPLYIAPSQSDLYERVIKECNDAIMAAILPQNCRCQIVSVTCLSCSSPATDGNYCAYCEHRRMREPIGFTGTFEGNVAWARNERALALEKPRSTATSRELAKPHPSTWPSQDGEW